MDARNCALAEMLASSSEATPAILTSAKALLLILPPRRLPARGRLWSYLYSPANCRSRWVAVNRHPRRPRLVAGRKAVRLAGCLRRGSASGLLDKQAR